MLRQLAGENEAIFAFDTRYELSKKCLKVESSREPRRVRQRARVLGREEKKKEDTVPRARYVRGLEREMLGTLYASANSRKTGNGWNSIIIAPAGATRAALSFFALFCRLRFIFPMQKRDLERPRVNSIRRIV